MPDRGPIDIRLLWTLTSLAFVTSLLRVYVRLRYHKFRWDDVSVICAMVRKTFSHTATRRDIDDFLADQENDVTED